MMRTVIASLIVFLIFQSAAIAKTFELDLYVQTDPRFLSGDFFRDYRIIETCTVKIADEAIGPNEFVNINNPDFKSFSCTLPGNVGTYTFSYGADIAAPDFWRGQDDDYDYGLLFDGAGNPLRFDSPQFSTSNLVGWYDIENRDTPEGPNIAGAPFLDPIVQDRFDIPAAVLLEPTVILGTERPRGDTVSSDLVPPGGNAALVNGEFTFFEGFTDPDGNSIQGARYGKFLSFDQRLRPPEVKITQAVFSDEEPIELIANRRTAVVVQLNSATHLSEQFELEMEIVDPTLVLPGVPGSGVVHGPVIVSSDSTSRGNNHVAFFCGIENNYCDLEFGEEYVVRVTIDKAGDIGEVYSGVPVEKRMRYSIVTKPMVVAFIELDPILCFSCGVSSDLRSEFQIRNARFLRSVFPIADSSFTVKEASRSLSVYAAGIDTTFKTDENGCQSVDPRGVINDLDRLRKNLLKNFSSFAGEKHLSGVASFNYWGFHNYNDQLGVSLPEIPNVSIISLPPSGGSTDITINDEFLLAHEVSHTDSFKIDHDGVVTGECEDKFIWNDTRIEGFDIYKGDSGESVDGAVDYMLGAGSIVEAETLTGLGVAGDQKRWVNDANWSKLLAQFTNQQIDPTLLMLSLVLSRDGSAELEELAVLNGFPNTLPPGETQVQVVFEDHQGQIIAEESVAVNFDAFVEGKQISVQEMPVSFSIVYPNGSAKILVYSKEGDLLLSKDPVIEVIESLARNWSEAPNECLSIPADTFNASMANFAQGVSELVVSENSQVFDGIEAWRMFLAQNVDRQCDLFGTNIGIIDDTFVALDVVAEELSLRPGFEEPELIPGDLDLDGDVDRDDLTILLASRNQPADGPDDPKDLDGDGTITGLDARKLTQLCTRPRCATI